MVRNGYIFLKILVESTHQITNLEQSKF